MGAHEDQFAVSAIQIDLPAWVNEGLDAEEEEALKDALLGIPGVGKVSLFSGGFLEVNEPHQLRAVQRAAEWVCRGHAKNPPAAQADALPFMMAVDGKVKVFDGISGVELDGRWSGLCTAAEDVRSLWYLGWDAGERSFTKLRSTERVAALQELQERFPAMGQAGEAAEWQYGANKGSVYRFPVEGGVASGYEWVATTDRELVGLPEDQETDEAHARRLADCANACRGMRDPVAEVSALRAAALMGPRAHRASHELPPADQPGNDGPART